MLTDSHKDLLKIYIPDKGKFILQVGARERDKYSVTTYDPIIYYVVENK